MKTRKKEKKIFDIFFEKKIKIKINFAKNIYIFDKFERFSHRII